MLNPLQPAYIFTPFTTSEDVAARPTKRRRVAKPSETFDKQDNIQRFQFESLLNGLESPDCVGLRQELFTKYWSETEERIQVRVIDCVAWR
jgi:origin recognition complex subunit 3